MPTLDLRLEFLNEEETKKIATRQMLSFLRPASEPPEEDVEPLLRRHAPSEALFSLGALPEGSFTEGPALFDWQSRDIYDVDGRLMLRDHTIDLGEGNEWRVRCAVSNLLRTPVWTVRAHRNLNVDGRIEKALAALRENPDLKPKFVDDETTVRLVSHNYPKLGILCERSDDSTNFVYDIGDSTIIPVHSNEEEINPESDTLIWSPYDIVVSSTIVRFRSIWYRDLTALPELPESVNDLPMAIVKAQGKIEQKHLTRPEVQLSPQENPQFCAPASAQMIMHHHGVNKSQDEIWAAMKKNPQGGVNPEDQVPAIFQVSKGVLRAEGDDTVSFEEAQREICAHRPFKAAVPQHARVCGGFRVDVDGKTWLYIYNPEPLLQGGIYWEAFEANRLNDFMYVCRVGYS